MLADGDGVGQAIIRELLLVLALRCCLKFSKLYFLSWSSVLKNLGADLVAIFGESHR
jgi:hypothetical protein